jgi:hypothetical protein
MGRACDMQRGEEKFIQGFGWKHEGKRSVVKHRHRWEYNTKKDE